MANIERICGFCEQTKVSKLCGGCKQIYYCSGKCQTNDWKNHKKDCKKLKKQRQELIGETLKNEAKQILVDFQSLQQIKQEIFSWVIFYEIKDRYFNALQYIPNDSNIYVSISMINYILSNHQNKYENAMEYALKSIEMNPFQCEGWIRFGLSCIKIKKYQLASIAFYTAKNIDINLYNSFNIKFGHFDHQYVIKFDQRFFNKIKEQQRILGHILDTNLEIKHIYSSKGGPSSNEFLDSMENHPISKQFGIEHNIYRYRKFIKYIDDKFIQSLNATDFVWNLVIYDDSKHDRNQCLDFPVINEIKYCIEITNSTKGNIAWINHGQILSKVHDAYSKWTAISFNWIYGEVTSKDIINAIRKTIVFHRLGAAGNAMSQKPFHIVIDNRLKKHFKSIKKEIESKFKIGCSLANQVPNVIVTGQYDGHVMI